jgi:hypothetical protein
MGAASCERSRTNISNKVEHDVPPNSPGAVNAQPCIPKQEKRQLPDEHLHSQVLERLEPHHTDAVNKRRSNLNIEHKIKLTKSSVEPQEQSEVKDSPDKV